MIRSNGRKIEYLRLSITKKCNLRCTYCLGSGTNYCSGGEQCLTADELLLVAEAFSKLGVKHIKITGGEPLIRDDTEIIIRGLKKIPGIKSVSLTTNGVLLAGRTKSLKDAGIDGINVSLDSLNADTYQMITGRRTLERVLSGIDESLSNGIPTKINSVLLRGINDDEIVSLAGLAIDKPLNIRFIELMPIGEGKLHIGIDNNEIMNILSATFGNPEPCQIKRGNGPAKYYDFKGLKGKIGFINANSEPFCEYCNKIRVTSDGRIVACILGDEITDISSIIACVDNPDELSERIDTLMTQTALSPREKGKGGNLYHSLCEIGG